MNSVIVLANLMTDESKRILMDNKKNKQNIPKDYVGRLIKAYEDNGLKH